MRKGTILTGKSDQEIKIEYPKTDARHNFLRLFESCLIYEREKVYNEILEKVGDEIESIDSIGYVNRFFLYVLDRFIIANHASNAIIIQAI